MPSSSSAPVPSRTLFGVALISGSLLITELSLTRIFSVTMYYHFAFMAISIALFGLSASGVYVFLMRDRWRDRAIDSLLGTHALAYAAVTGVALAILVRIRVDLTYTAANLAWISLVYLVSALPFFFGGATISIAIARLSKSVNAVYAADLLGAGAGCVVLIPVVNFFGAPGAIIASALLGIVATFSFTARGRAAAGATAAALITAAALGAFAVGVTKNHQAGQVLFSKWNSFSRIGVYNTSFNAWSLSPRYTGPVPDDRLMDIDSAAATQIIRFDGDLKKVSYLEYELTALGYHLFDKGAFDALVIGTGGGRDLLSALVFGATRIEGVEINPIIVNDVMRGKFRDYSGDVYDHPGVTITVEDGRSFVRRSPKQYDIIQASLVDTWAATAAGAYSLSENSLYTVEAFNDYLDHLTDRGVVSISRWVFDGLRLVSLAQETCARRGWNAADHVAIIQQDRVATFLLKKTPFTADETALLANAAKDLDFTVMYLPGHPPQTFGDGRDEYTRLLLAPDRQAFYRDFPLDVAPTTDDRPFFFHTTRLRNHWSVAPILRLFGLQVVRADNPGSWGTGGLTALLILLTVSTGLIVLFVLGPLALTSRDALGTAWFASLAYFGCLGAGFMLIEVALLQRFVLLLGHPVYSLTVTLFSLLVGTGLGSVLGRRVPDARVRRRSMLACVGVAVIAVLWASVLPSVVQAAIAAPLVVRISVAVALMLPAGMVMGMPLPGGVRLLAMRQPQLIAWAWGINGALSVLGATLAVFIAMNWGFSITLLSGAALYGAAAVNLARSEASETDLQVSRSQLALPTATISSDQLQSDRRRP